jgi:hypothetical protein
LSPYIKDIKEQIKKNFIYILKILKVYLKKFFILILICEVRKKQKCGGISRGTFQTCPYNFPCHSEFRSLERDEESEMDVVK